MGRMTEERWTELSESVLELMEECKSHFDDRGHEEDEEAAVDHPDTEDLCQHISILEAILESKVKSLQRKEEEIVSLQEKVKFLEDELVNVKQNNSTPERVSDAESLEKNANEKKEAITTREEDVTQEKCFFFETKGYCKFKHSCFYKHPKDCRYWLKGFCRRSDNDCQFRHNPKLKGNQDHNSGFRDNSSAPFLDSISEKLLTAEITKVLNRM